MRYTVRSYHDNLVDLLLKSIGSCNGNEFI